MPVNASFTVMKMPKFKPLKTPDGWCVNIPAQFSRDGKRLRRFFASREQAETFASRLRAQIAQHGTAVRILSPTKTDVALRAFAMLGENVQPETLLEAVREYVGRHNT